MKGGGSSPLARGLPAWARPYRNMYRIIPARAGFTTRTAATSAPARDHPRSRGVYSIPGVQDRSVAGSSPLARGLRGHEAVAGDGRRIIPARAGFTASSSVSAARSPDHPRSRGVYLKQIGRDVEKTGSSPLARGLRHAENRKSKIRRIIPARAGFT